MTGFDLRMGFVWTGNTLLEFLEPVDDRSPHATWLRERGEGLHHLGYLVRSIDHELDAIAAASPSLARQELYPDVLDGRIYVAGGLLSPNTGYSAHVEAYDPRLDRWTRLATLPEARHHIALVAAGGIVYGVGGFSGGFPNWKAQASMFAYDPGTNRWTNSVPLSIPRAEGVAAAVNGKVYLIGRRIGTTPDAAPTVLRSGQWTRSTPSRRERPFCSAAGTRRADASRLNPRR